MNHGLARVRGEEEETKKEKEICNHGLTRIFTD
jgi:hypothetical protein